MIPIISSAILFKGVVCRSKYIPFPTDLTGYKSYVGHPDTRKILESLGAITDDGNGYLESDPPIPIPGRYEGPTAAGEQYLCVPLVNNPRKDGWTQHVAVESIEQLQATLVTCLYVGDEEIVPVLKSDIDGMIDCIDTTNHNYSLKVVRNILNTYIREYINDQ